MKTWQKIEKLKRKERKKRTMEEKNNAWRATKKETKTQRNEERLVLGKTRKGKEREKGWVKKIKTTKVCHTETNQRKK